MAESKPRDISSFQEELKELSSRFEILEIVDDSTRTKIVSGKPQKFRYYIIKFLDRDSNTIFTTNWSGFKNRIKKNPSHRFKSDAHKSTFTMSKVDSANARLKKYPHIEALSFDGETYHLIDKRTGSTFSYQCISQLLKYLEKNPEKLFKGGSLLEEWQNRVKLLGSSLQVKEILEIDDRDGRVKRLLIENQSGKQFPLRTTTLVGTLARNSSHLFPKAASDWDPNDVRGSIERRIKSLGAHHLSLISYRKVKSATKYRVKIHDSRFDMEFEYNLWSMVRLLSMNPEYEFCPGAESLKQKSIRNNSWKLLNGLPMSEVATKYNISETYVHKLFNIYGQDLGTILESYTHDKSSLETNISVLLTELRVEFIQNKKFAEYFPDFRIPSHKLIVECDGLYWHSERFYGKQYHKKKMEIFNQEGYRLIAFREDDFLRPDVIESLVKNALGMSISVGARKLSFCEVDSEFFVRNHLMGCGSKKTGIGLERNGEPLIGATFRQVAQDHWEIDRLCTKIGHQVPGGLSRILNKFMIEYQPKSITSFVDLRHGTGRSLEALGFQRVSMHVGFRWTKGSISEGRRAYLGSSGYEAGFQKIYDYGQAKYVKTI